MSKELANVKIHVAVIIKQNTKGTKYIHEDVYVMDNGVGTYIRKKWDKNIKKWHENRNSLFVAL